MNEQTLSAQLTAALNQFLREHKLSEVGIERDPRSHARLWLVACGCGWTCEAPMAVTTDQVEALASEEFQVVASGYDHRKQFTWVEVAGRRSPQELWQVVFTCRYRYSPSRATNLDPVEPAPRDPMKPVWRIQAGVDEHPCGDLLPPPARL